MTEEGLVVETTVPPAPSATYAASGHGQFGRTQAERYLARFGYLQVDPETSPDAETYVSEALRSFQVAHGLPETGKLDEQTSALMERPRCGVPNRASLRAFIPQGSQWNKYTLRYALGELTPDLSGDEVRDACVQAFALWSDVTHLRFVEVGNLENPDIVLRFLTGNHGDDFPFDGPGKILAHAFYPPPAGGGLAGDVHFDDAEVWTISLPPGGFDLVSVAAHEIGHALGLDHSKDPSALMYEFYSLHRYLAPDDVAGIQSIYGNNTDWSGWDPLGGWIDRLGLGQDQDGRLHAFARGANRDLWHIAQRVPNGSFGDWRPLGGLLHHCNAAPVAARNSDGRMSVFVIGAANDLWCISQTAPNGEFGGWTGLGGWIDRLSVGRNADGRLEVFARGQDGSLWHVPQTSPSGGFGSWQGLGGWIDQLTVGQHDDGRLIVFARGGAKDLYQIAQTTPGGAFGAWQSLGGIINWPVAARNADGRISVFVMGAAHDLYQITQASPNGPFGSWQSLGGWIDLLAVTQTLDGRIEVFARGEQDDLYQISQSAPNGSFGAWRSLGGQVYRLAPPVPRANADGRLEVLVIGSAMDLWHKWR